MNRNLKILPSVFVVVTCATGLGPPTRAGDLNPPPGPIGPTMKPLDQVEPRTPISSLPYTITQPGSYYLTGNLTGVAGQNGITVVSSDVTIDLMGFTLYGVPGSLDGIAGTMLPITVHNVTIHNGTVRGWGGNGVNLTNVSLNFRKIEVAGNGGHGAVLGSYSHLEEVSFRSNGGNGATVGSYAHMEEVSFASNGGMGAQIGSYAHMEEVSFSYNGGGGAIVGSAAHMEEVSFCYNTGNGLVLGDTCIVTRCIVEGNTQDGLVGGASISITDVVASSNGGRGIVLDKATPALHKALCNGNGGDGIVLGENGTCENCTAQGNAGRGIVAGVPDDPLLTSVVKRIDKSRAVGNGGDGIVLGANAICNDCTAQGNAGRGIVADKASPKLYRALAVGNTGGDGIVLGNNATCENCTAEGNGGVGINKVIDQASPKLYGARAVGNGSDGIILGTNATCNDCTAEGNTGRGIVADKSSPKLYQCLASGNTGGDGIVLGEGGTARNCTSRNNVGNGIYGHKNEVDIPTCVSEGNTLDGFVVGPGSTLTDCRAINNGGNGIHVTDNNVPPKTATVVLRGCVARGNGAIGFKMTQPPVIPPSAGAAQVPTRDQGIATPAAPAAPMPLDVEKATAGPSVRPARGASLAMPLASVRFAGTGFGCVAEENLGDGFYLDGEWSLSQCVSRNNGGVGINSFSFGIGRGTVAEGNTSDGFVLRGGYILTECTSRGNGGVGFHVTDNNSPAKGGGCVAEGNGLDGFIVTSGAMLTACTAQGNGTTGVGSGIRVTGTSNRLEGNHLLGNLDWGLSLFGGGNLVIGNSASGNTGGNYNIPSGNATGPIVTTTDMATNTSPNVNYDY